MESISINKSQKLRRKVQGPNPERCKVRKVQGARSSQSDASAIAGLRGEDLQRWALEHWHLEPNCGKLGLPQLVNRSHVILWEVY